jgi:hypothetical protein
MNNINIIQNNRNESNIFNSPINNNANYQIMNNNNNLLNHMNPTIFINNNINLSKINNNNNNNNNYGNFNQKQDILSYNVNNNQNLYNNINNNSMLVGKYYPNPSKYVGGFEYFSIDSPKNTINLINILKNKDKRTTLIIRNIPNKYTISLLLVDLNKKFENKFDIVYLPRDYLNNLNLGFGFINFIHHMHLLLFYEEFAGKKWSNFNSKKMCQLAYSKYQGRNDLIKYIQSKLGINKLNNINTKYVEKTFYINNGVNNKILPQVEIPSRYYSMYLNYYPFSVYHWKNDDIFVVDNFY